MTTKALILAAGLGSRLKPATDYIPKCLIPIRGRPLLDYWICKLRPLVSEALINTHHLPELVNSYIWWLSIAHGFNLIESYESTLLGSAGTLIAAKEYLSDADDIIIIYADNYSAINISYMLDAHWRHQYGLTIALFRPDCTNAAGYGIVEMADGNFGNGTSWGQSAIVTKFTEKPDCAMHDIDTFGGWANAGIYIISKEVYTKIIKTGGFDMAHDILPKFINKMIGFYDYNRHFDIGTPARYKEANNWLLFEPMITRSPAVFYDRDGTIIEGSPDPIMAADVRLIPGASDVIAARHLDEYKNIVISNQSHIGKGVLSIGEFNKTNERMQVLLKQEASEAKIDAIYHAPFVPATKDRTIIENFNRKPGPGMIWQAAIEHGIDIGASIMVGDMISDQLAGINAGCKKSFVINDGIYSDTIPSIKYLLHYQS